MALVSCRECGKQVSGEAKTCPHCGISDPEPPRQTGAEKWGLRIVVAMGGGAIFLWLMGALFSLGDAGDERVAPPREETVEVTESSSPEAKLVVVELGSRSVPESMVQDFGRLFDELEGACRESRSRIADMTLAARNSLLEQYGKQISITEMLRAEATMMRESGLTDQICAEAFSLLVVTLGAG